MLISSTCEDEITVSYCSMEWCVSKVVSLGYIGSIVQQQVTDISVSSSMKFNRKITGNSHLAAAL
jgi:hypothetical protein